MAVIQGIDTEYKPWGGLAGFNTGERRAEMDAANMQELQQSQLNNALKEIEARRAQADYSNPEMEQWRQQGIMGKNMSDYSKGQLDYKTLDSSVKAKLAENLQKASDADIASTTNGLEMFIATGSSGHPLAMHQAMASLPPQMKQMVQQLEAREPGSSVRYAQQLLDTIKQARADTPALRGKITEKDREYENQEIIHQGDRQSREDISARETAARYADIAERRSQANQGKEDSAAMRREAELTRRLGVINSEWKANETELNRLDEEISTVGSMNLPGRTKAEKEKEKERMRSAIRAQKDTILSTQKQLREEAKRLSGLSIFSDKSVTTESQATPKLPPGVTIKK